MLAEILWKFLSLLAILSAWLSLSVAIVAAAWWAAGVVVGAIKKRGGA